MSDAPIMPETGTPVAATVVSTAESYTSRSMIVVGGERMASPFPHGSAGFMFAVIDLSDLSVVAQAAPVGISTVPPQIQPYAGKEGFFLFFSAVNQTAAGVPQGDLYTFLMDAGAGAKLENLEQIAAQIGTGSLGAYSYILASRLDSGDLPGYEVMSVSDLSVLAMQFLPLTINGKTVYTPSRHTTP